MHAAPDPLAAKLLRLSSFSMSLMALVDSDPNRIDSLAHSPCLHHSAQFIEVAGERGNILVSI